MLGIVVLLVLVVVLVLATTLVCMCVCDCVLHTGNGELHIQRTGMDTAHVPIIVTIKFVLSTY